MRCTGGRADLVMKRLDANICIELKVNGIIFIFTIKLLKINNIKNLSFVFAVS